MIRKVSKVVVLSVVTSFLITGCAIKPEPMLKEEVKEQVKKDLSVLSEVVLPVTKPISLDEAIQRGLNHNLQKRVKVLETALSQQQLDLVYYDMLPSLTASAGYSERNNYAASASTSFVNGEPQPLGANPSYSISQDKERVTSDIGFSWNILDFGLSYVRAQQQADKFLIAKEKEKKVEHNLTQEIRRAYYQAVSAQDLLKRIQPMMVEVNQALSDSKKVQNQRVGKTPMESLSYQRELLDILRSLHTLESSLISAKVELAELMGLKPGIEFELADKVEKNYQIPEFNMNLEQMELLALENRPEVTESRYQERISEKEITAAKLKMLPGINLNTSLSYENSDYLLNNDWYSYGANVSWNLLNVFKGSEMNKLAKTQVEIAKEQLAILFRC
jgi:outer membrane protein TolC